jgi:hypothetical protein
MRSLRVLGGLTVAALFGIGCGSTQADELTVGSSPAEVSAATTPDFTPNGRVHLMPFHDPNEPAPVHEAVTAHLTYYGGKVIPNVKVVAVFWGSSVNSTVTSGIGGYYTAVTNSEYFDWLSEYNTGTQSIGRGTLQGTYTITPGTTGSNLTDAQIQTEINNQINAGHLPVPDANTLYMTYFPAGVKITSDGSSSCVSGGFCAYHGTFNGTKGEIYYGVLPDMSAGSGCDTGCGSSTMFNNMTSVSSHEMIEAVTDAEVGLATVVGAPLAWYDSTNGEIGDICNAQQGTVAGYTVQKEFDNATSTCIVSKAGGGGGGGGGALTNGGFESGATGWTATAGVVNNDSTLSHTGSWEAYLDGYGTTHTDTLSQSFTVPSTATTLTYWLKITTSETTTTTQYDKLTVQLKNSAGTVLATQSYSNLNKSSSYSQKSLSVTAYRGQTITFSVTGSEDSSLQTSFFIDDVSVQ